MGWVGPTIAAVGSVANSAISAASQSNLNLANREWSAQQAQIARNFQASEQLQAEQYNTQMSDTAEQRRVADLRAAGLNPMLAAGNPASAPTMSAPGGAMASTPSTANPFGGNTVQAAMQSARDAATTAQLQAQTDKTAAEAKVLNAQVPYAAAQAYHTTNNLEQETYNLQQKLQLMDQDWDFNNLVRNPQGMDAYAVQRELWPLQIQGQQLDIQKQRYGMPSLAADADFWNSLSPGMRRAFVGMRDLSGVDTAGVAAGAAAAASGGQTPPTP